MMLILGYILCLVVSYKQCCGTERVYYIASVEDVWDYAPGGNDLTQLHGNDKSAVYLNGSEDRIGHRYKKIMYREYTDDTYSIERRRPEWLGLLGPVMMAEIGDVLRVNFKNKGHRNYSIHPLGFATPVKTSPVPPDGRHSYSWTVDDDSGPSEGDPDCITTMYHSDVARAQDIASGLVGFLILCRRGALNRWSDRPMFTLYMGIFDENLSWFLDENIETFINSTVDKTDEAFIQSNKMHSFNGFVYGHLPGLLTSLGESSHWHVGSLGGGVNVHSLVVSGHTFKYFNHSSDSIRLSAAEFATAELTATSRGRWLVTDRSNDYDEAGMTAFLDVHLSNSVSPPDMHIANTRRYYIAAEEIMWDYASSGRNKYEGGSLTEVESYSERYFKQDDTHIGGVYKKVLYQEYTNFLFRRKKNRSPDDEHHGFLGPVIRAEVGDLIKVVFYNKASRPYSIHPFGVQFSKLDEGYSYNDGRDGTDHVLPGSVRTYFWTIPEHVGPAWGDPPCIARMYTSGVDETRDGNSGLVGPLLICRKGSLDEDGHQINVTKEFFLMFSSTDENKSWYLQENINISSVPADIDIEQKEFYESNIMHNINGRMFGNLDGLDVCLGGLSVWHVFSGTENVDTLTVRGNSFNVNQRQHITNVDLKPGTAKSLTMLPRYLGTWGLSTGNPEHFVAGSKAVYKVNQCSGAVIDPVPPLPVGRTVKKYIQITEKDWNYAPSGTSGESDMLMYTESGPSRIGSTYRKAIFEEYRDESFSKLKARYREEAYLGLLGPVIRVEVGDVLEVVLKNMAQRQFSISSPRLRYNEVTGGRGMVSGPPSVFPGRKFTLTFNVTEESGPGDGDPECVTNFYFSHVDVLRDISSGLLGPLLICMKGSLKMSRGELARKRQTVQKEFVLYFSVFDENLSWYFDDNLANITGDPSAIDLEDEAFRQSNKMHSINGYVAGSQPKLEMTEGETVDWHILGLGADVHSISFRGNDIVNLAYSKRIADVVPVYPLVPLTLRMRAVNEGTWMLYCHVNEHYLAGMRSSYTVKEDIFSTFSRGSS